MDEAHDEVFKVVNDAAGALWRSHQLMAVDVIDDVDDPEGLAKYMAVYQGVLASFYHGVRLGTFLMRQFDEGDWDDLDAFTANQFVEKVLGCVALVCSGHIEPTLAGYMEAYQEAADDVDEQMTALRALAPVPSGEGAKEGGVDLLDALGKAKGKVMAEDD